MSNGLNRQRKPKTVIVDFEAKAAEAKAKRIEDCMNEINGTLEKYKCDVQCAVEIAGQLVPLSVVLNFPNKVQILSK